MAQLRDLENEAKDERIAVLEREIAEDKHIHALKAPQHRRVVRELGR